MQHSALLMVYCRPPQDLARLEGLVTSVGAAALHGLDRADTQRKVDLVLRRIESITKVSLNTTAFVCGASCCSEGTWGILSAMCISRPTRFSRIERSQYVEVIGTS